ncbi:MAG TPA: secretin N-terminal domain-containing protein [Verrucomicrobiae bacterium]|nr:secretin N-terminal domain-containing protein [Verrucomicrobiae bacterium]
MKAKILILAVAGFLACNLSLRAQESTDAATTTNETSVAVTNSVNETSPPAAEVTTADSTTTTSNEVASVSATPTSTSSENSETASGSTTNASATIPLIVMDEVPLTDAIKNLARQANINYMLDPKISYGQTGQDGRPIPQPSVSLRWENVSAEQALLALLNNYNLQIVEDAKTKIARVTVKDPAAPDPLETQIIQLQYANPSNLVTAVQSLLTDPLHRSKVVADVRTSQLVVLATEKELAAINDMVTNLDTPTKQVLIEARLLETSINPQSIKGLDWRGTLQAQQLSLGNNLQQNTPELSVNNTLSQTLPKLLMDTAHGFNPATAFLDADGVSAVFSFINQNSKAKVISSPSTVTLDNETATLSVTRASPIINVTAGTANTTGGSQITYTNLGVILDVTPRISANNFINLHVVPEVSRIFDTVTKVINGTTFQADEYDIRRMETHVMIPSGNTLVLGGLVQDDMRDTSTKVPVLGDIPILGKAFHSDSKIRQKNNLLVFITPTIIQNSDYQPTRTTLLQTPLPPAENEKWTSWNTTEPYDWSKLTSGPKYDPALFDNNVK